MDTNYPTSVTVEPPTAFLPSLARLAARSTDEVSDALEKLRRLYWPSQTSPNFPPSTATLRGTISASKRTESAASSGPELQQKLLLSKGKIAALVSTPDPDVSVPDSGYASAEEDEADADVAPDSKHKKPYAAFASPLQSGEEEDDVPEVPGLESLRADPLEREYAVKWTTGLITRSDAWIELAVDDEDRKVRNGLLEEVTSVLAAFTCNKEDENGNDEDESLTRRFEFQTNLRDEIITVELNDAALPEDDHTSVGLQSWTSSILFAAKLCLAPKDFLFGSSSSPPKRILELGAGTGMLSIVSAKIMTCQASLASSLMSSPCSYPEIVATDFHPDVLANLQINIDANLVLDECPVAVHTLDWENPSYTKPLAEPFDVILAADVIYHPDHARWIRSCVERLLARPAACGLDGNLGKGGVFWMIMALRTIGRHEGLDRTVEAMFPYAMHDVPQKEKNDWRLAVLASEEVDKGGRANRADETGYRLFKIGWVPSV